MKLSIIAVRLWHDVLHWEPGLVGITDSGYGRSGIPCFCVWYAPKPWGGRGLALCAKLALNELQAHVTPSVQTSSQHDLFATTVEQKPHLVFSTKCLTARPDIPPFIDSDCWGRMLVQLDWHLDHGLVPELRRDHARGCAKTVAAAFSMVGNVGLRRLSEDCDCGYDDGYHRDDGFKLVALWREAELRASIETLKPGWAEGLLADPRKVTLRGRSNSREHREKHNPPPVRHA